MKLHWEAEQEDTPIRQQRSIRSVTSKSAPNTPGRMGQERVASEFSRRLQALRMATESSNLEREPIPM